MMRRSQQGRQSAAAAAVARASYQQRRWNMHHGKAAKDTYEGRNMTRLAVAGTTLVELTLETSSFMTGHRTGVKT
jgi:hypothetical protein